MAANGAFYMGRPLAALARLWRCDLDNDDRARTSVLTLRAYINSKGLISCVAWPNPAIGVTAARFTQIIDPK